MFIKAKCGTRLNMRLVTSILEVKRDDEGWVECLLAIGRASSIPYTLKASDLGRLDDGA